MSSTKPELDAMASRFVELWQEQWQHLMNNPETASMMTRMSGMMQQPNPFQRFFTEGAHDSASSFRAAPPATTLESLAHQLDQLATRVDALSQRLDTGSKPRAAKPRAKPVKAKPKPLRSRAGKGRTGKAK